MSHCALNADPTGDAPLPMTRIQALHRAADLKRKGWTWTAITRVMGEYHGHWLAPSTWRYGVSSLGLVVPKRAMTPAKVVVLERATARAHERDEARRVAAKLPVDGVAA